MQQEFDSSGSVKSEPPSVSRLKRALMAYVSTAGNGGDEHAYLPVVRDNVLSIALETYERAA